jgi:hypothetical protein
MHAACVPGCTCDGDHGAGSFCNRSKQRLESPLPRARRVLLCPRIRRNFTFWHIAAQVVSAVAATAVPSIAVALRGNNTSCNRCTRFPSHSPPSRRSNALPTSTSRQRFSLASRGRAAMRRQASRVSCVAQPTVVDKTVGPRIELLRQIIVGCDNNSNACSHRLLESCG